MTQFQFKRDHMPYIYVGSKLPNNKIGLIFTHEMCKPVPYQTFNDNMNGAMNAKAPFPLL